MSKHGGGEAAEKIILRLKALNYLDDRLFAQNLFNYAVNNFRGPRYLEARLQKSGVAIEITMEVLERYGEELEKELISEILKKNKEKAKKNPHGSRKSSCFRNSSGQASAQSNPACGMRNLLTKAPAFFPKKSASRR